jgi:3-deoxy-D-manno-octulosonic-acid transferase
VSRPRRPLPLALYGAGARLLEPLAPRLLAARARAGKEAPGRLDERLGRASVPRPPGPLVWLHGASVGESLSLLPLAEALRRARPGLGLLVTSGTRTSAEVLGRRLPPGVIHQFAPVDAPEAVARFLDHWSPDAAFFAESELWPNLILAAASRGVRLGLLSARITEKSAAGWSRAAGSARALLEAFSLILPQDAASGRRLAALGARPGPELNLKRTGAPPPCDDAELARLRAALGPRRVLLAASTHAGEEAPIARAWLGAAPDLLIIAPRHPERAGDIAAELAQEGLAVARRSAGEPLPPAPGVYLADTLGELGLFLRVAPVVVMGGGFAAGVGGHNPLEAAQLGCAILTGPHVANAQALYDEMTAEGAALRVADGAALAAELARLAGDPRAAEALGATALAYARRQAGRLEAALPLILELIPT